jgi:hypothetical protein
MTFRICARSTILNFIRPFPTILNPERVKKFCSPVRNWLTPAQRSHTILAKYK